jgi:hypothetical protein
MSWPFALKAGIDHEKKHWIAAKTPFSRPLAA